mmetsp:Transcript_57835/g.117625  ORF Transcript_57835/g.117625 Transcript_57835/m.117625 type:complete len:313 (+) Transcript_57835:247-1185(+)
MLIRSSSSVKSRTDVLPSSHSISTTSPRTSFGSLHESLPSSGADSAIESASESSATRFISGQSSSARGRRSCRIALASSGSIHVKSPDLLTSSMCRARASSRRFAIAAMFLDSFFRDPSAATSAGFPPSVPSMQPLVFRRWDSTSFLRLSRRNRIWLGETPVSRSEGVRLSQSHSRMTTRWLGSFQKQCCSNRKSRASTFFLPSDAALIFNNRAAFTRRLSLTSMSWFSRRKALRSLINSHASSSIRTESLADDSDRIMPSRSPTSAMSHPSSSSSLPSVPHEDSPGFDIDRSLSTPSSDTGTTSFRMRNLS